MGLSNRFFKILGSALVSTIFVSTLIFAGSPTGKSVYRGEGVCSFPNSTFKTYDFVIEKRGPTHFVSFFDKLKPSQKADSEKPASGEISNHTLILNHGTYTLEVRVTSSTASGSIVGKFPMDRNCAGTFSAVLR